MSAADGFTHYLRERPSPDALVRFWNEANGERWTGYARDIHPYANVACIWWKLTGIERAEDTQPDAFADVRVAWRKGWTL